MKFPKNRANCYVVIRNDHTRAVCGAFFNPEEADDFAAACEQEWKDKFPAWEAVPTFKVELTTFYD